MTGVATLKQDLPRRLASALRGFAHDAASVLVDLAAYPDAYVFGAALARLPDDVLLSHSDAELELLAVGGELSECDGQDHHTTAADERGAPAAEDATDVVSSERGTLAADVRGRGGATRRGRRGRRGKGRRRGNVEVQTTN